MINRGSLGCKWYSFKKCSNSPSHRESPLDPCNAIANEFYMNASLFPSSQLKTSPESCLLGGGNFRCWITRLRDPVLHSTSGGLRCSLRATTTTFFKPAAACEGLQREGSLVREVVGTSLEVKRHKRSCRAPTTSSQGSLCKNSIRSTPNTPPNVVAIHFILSPLSHFLGSSERRVVLRSEKDGYGNSLTLL